MASIIVSKTCSKGVYFLKSIAWIIKKPYNFFNQRHFWVINVFKKSCEDLSHALLSTFTDPASEQDVTSLTSSLQPVI